MKIIFDETKRVQLKHPVTGEGLYLQDAKGKDIKDKPMEVEIYGKHTAVYKNAVTALFKKRTEEGEEATEGLGLELLARCTSCFHNLDVTTEHGKLDPNNIKECFDKAFWIKDQVDRAITKLDLFIQAP